MRRTLLLLTLAACSTAQAQVSLTMFDGTTESPVGTVFDFGRVALGSSKDVRFRLHNNGSTSTTLTALSAGGTGFTLVGPPSLGYVIAPSNFAEFTVRFAGTSAALYSATLQTNSIGTILTATSATTATVATAAGCAGPTTQSPTIDFGKVQTGQSATCTLTFAGSPSAIQVTGPGFSYTGISATAATLRFTPTAPGAFTGTLVVDGLRTYNLTAQAYAAPFPTPTISVDVSTPASNQQPHVSVALPSPATSDATGSLTLSFLPDPLTATDDSSVMFLSTGTRTLPVSIKQGSSQFSIGGQPSAVFQTGTTSGRIQFGLTLNTPFSGDPTRAIVLAPQQVAVDSASAIRQSGGLKISIIGFDNTYSAGNMAFTFYDPSGNPLGPVSADFTSNFKTYFTQNRSGSAFLVGVTFPIVGDASLVGSVDVTLANSAGQTILRGLAFQ